MRVMWATGRRRSRAIGFSLLELLVVLSILVMSALAFPMSTRGAWATRRVEADARRAVAVLREAALHSLVAGRIVTVGLEPNGLRLALGARSKYCLLESTIRAVDGSGFELQKLIFYPDGSSPSSDIEVRYGERSRRILINAVTGSIRIMDDDG